VENWERPEERKKERKKKEHTRKRQPSSTAEIR
jgi:hypothetical protein